MFTRHTSRPRVAMILGILGVVAAGVLVAVFAPSITPGYDTTFTLAWGRDLAHGLTLDFTHPSSPTPHPLALVAGLGAGFAPVHWVVNAAGGLGVAAGLATLALLGLVTFQVTESRIATGAAVATAAASAPVGLLVFGASSDVTYCAIGLSAVLLTLQRRHAGAVAAFMVAALLRPDAVLLAMVPVVLSYIAHRDLKRQRPDHQRTDQRRTDQVNPDLRDAAARPAWVRTAWVFAAGLILAVAAWLATGAAGGDPLIALHSASTNAQVNNDPRGPLTALTHALPGLAGPTGWLTVWAAAIVLFVTAAARRARAAREARPFVHKAPTRRAPARKAPTPNAPTSTGGSPPSATITSGIFIGLGLVAYLAQGFTGTPLVARYLLLPALLCVTLAARCVPLASQFARNAHVSTAVAVILGAGLVVASVSANVPGWKDVAYARDVRTAAFTAAAELLHTDLARQCEAPVVVRSPAMVAVTALILDRPLRDITVADQAGNGVLLQPLTQEAAELAGYGPVTPLNQQGVFPADAPPRQSNTHWALYSSCQP